MCCRIFFGGNMKHKKKKKPRKKDSKKVKSPCAKGSATWLEQLVSVEKKVEEQEVFHR
jgi:hypothetical protein